MQYRMNESHACDAWATSVTWARTRWVTWVGDVGEVDDVGDGDKDEVGDVGG